MYTGTLKIILTGPTEGIISSATIEVGYFTIENKA